MARPDHFMISGGDLYDTRRPNWHNSPPLRHRFYWSAQSIRSADELKAALRYGSTTDLGGYPLYFIAADGQALSFAAVRANLRTVLEAMRDGDKQWSPVAVEINYEDGELTCAHTGERIPSAYAD